ncbi:MAG: carboxypeptidase regulatory-like domain-containing protein [Deltaproteobacteria bacterium]|nr:carboxypeptidase regulatory-like domain-containing protein [Deltaproteobacteria bacterium]
MRLSSRIVSVHLLTAYLLPIALLAVPATSFAIPTGAPQRCQAEVGKQGKAFFDTVSRAIGRCEGQIASGALPPATDCTLELKAAAKLAKATGNLTVGIANRCSDASVGVLVFGDDCYGSETAADLAACQVDVHRARALQLINIVYGTTGAVADAGQRKCQAKVAKEAKKLGVRRQDSLRRCKDDIGKGDLPPDTDCNVEIAPKLSLARAKAIDGIQAKCDDAEVDALVWGGACASASTVDAIVACALGTHEQGVDNLIVAEYGSGPNGGTSSLAEITDENDCVDGPLSRCREGDYLLANDEIRVVVQDVGRNMLAVGEFGGQIIDADLVRTGSDPDRDHFEEWTSMVNIENGAHYTDLTILNDGSDGQAAILRATGVDDILDFVNPSSVVSDFGFTFPAALDDTNLPLEITTDYILEPGANYVRVDTTFTNTSASGISVYLGAYIAGSGQIETFLGGYGFGEPLIATTCPTTATNPCNYIAYGAFGDALGVSYGFVHDIPNSSSFSTSGVSVPFFGAQVVLALINAISPNFPIAAAGDPGDSVTVTQYFVVGDGSVSSILDARNAIQFIPTGTISGTAMINGGPVEGARISVLGVPLQGPGLGLLTRNVLTQAVTDASGEYSVALPPGNYTVVAHLDRALFEGGGATPLSHPVTVSAYQSTTRDITFPNNGAVDITVTDELGNPIAAKATIVGFDPSVDPRNFQNIFGLISNTTGVFRDPGQDVRMPHGLANAFFIDQSGLSGVQPLEPGSYRVVVSHGPEYSIATADITVTAGATTPVSVQIARVIDTTGFVASDFHVHSIDSPDSKVSRRERLTSMVSEGVDFFTPSDHETRQDFNPDIVALGMTGLISVAPSAEITTFDYGHFNAWPMTIDPNQVNGGSVDHGGAAPPGEDFPSEGNYSLTPAEIVAAAHADPGTDTVQINHFYSHFGIGQSGLAIDTGMTPPQSSVPGSVRRLDPSVTNYFTDTFDALEIFIESDRTQIFDNFYGRNLGDWINLINQGIVRTAVSNSDTHRRVTTLSGFPRTMVASPTDDPGLLAGIADSLSQNVNDGRAIGTNGPMLRITTSAASTASTGGLELGLPTTIATTDGSVDVTVEIQSPIWAEFDTVEFYVNSVTDQTVVQENVGDPMVDPIDVASYTVTPDFVHTAGTEFTVTPVVVYGMIPGASRLEATTTLNLSGLTEDVWIVAIVRGTDGVSQPTFPVIPFNLNTGSNLTLADLIDGNLNEGGVPTLAYTNPVFVDVDGDGWTPPGVRFNP